MALELLANISLRLFFFLDSVFLHPSYFLQEPDIESAFEGRALKHRIWRLVEGFLIIASNADQSESVANKLSFHLFVKNAGAAQRWEAVHFEHPWFEGLIEYNIEPINFKAAALPIA
jgi:hypothetical protein